MAAKMLIIEDDSNLVDLLRSILTALGFEVQTADDGETGIAAARKFLPDVILLDIMIPRLSGFDVCRILSTDAKTKGAKIIMMTGLDKMGDVEKAFSCGACDYLIKPFDSERLIKKVNKVLGREGR